MKIGLCGGTFDPFHRGHLDPVLAVRERMGWNRLLYFPAFVQPFKRDRRAASGYHRFTMAVLATERHAEVFIEPFELERGAVSYTVDTLAELRERFGADVTLDWIIGDDNLARLEEWKDIDRILALANFAVLTRGAVQHEAVPERLRSHVAEASTRGPAGAICFAGNSTVAVSSTEIRQRVRDGQPIDHLVDGRVSRYIQHYGLYQEAGS